MPVCYVGTSTLYVHTTIYVIEQEIIKMSLDQ